MTEFKNKKEFLDNIISNLKTYYGDDNNSNEKKYSYNLIDIKSIPQNPTFHIDRYENILSNFTVRPSDTFVVTYVKAGTTWTQQIIHLLLRQGIPGGQYGESVPWLEALSSDILDSREAPTWSIEKLDNFSLETPRYFKTHANIEIMPEHVNYFKNKIIYVARNPKDTAVSLYHHARNKPEFQYNSDFQTFVYLFLLGKVENGCWFKHVKDWYQLSKDHPENILFLQYEEMYQNPTIAVEKIANFLSIPVTPEIISQVVKHSSIDEMRQKASIGMNHLRAGGYGGWRNLFTASMNELFDEIYKQHMKDQDLQFNFGPNIYQEDQFM